MSHVRLRKIARHYAGRSAMSADDIMAEALARALDGTRKCPRDVNLLAFLATSVCLRGTDTRRDKFRACGAPASRAACRPFRGGGDDRTADVITLDEVERIVI
jgi:DNA-directed RNA polymerase specialized sigma24 family protein